MSARQVSQFRGPSNLAIWIVSLPLVYSKKDGIVQKLDHGRNLGRVDRERVLCWQMLV